MVAVAFVEIVVVVVVSVPMDDVLMTRQQLECRFVSIEKRERITESWIYAWYCT